MQHTLWAKVKASLGGVPLKVTPAKGQKWRNVLGKLHNKKGWWYGVKKEDRMDVDAAEVNALSVEEQNQLQKEGKCFNCQKVEHIGKNCSSKRDASKNSTLCANQGMSAHVAKTEEGGKKAVAEEIKAMTAEERNELLDNLVLQGF
jgi:Zinc knuckle